jgi:hypothetical protein
LDDCGYNHKFTWMIGVITINFPLTTQQFTVLDLLRDQRCVPVHTAINIHALKKAENPLTFGAHAHVLILQKVIIYYYYKWMNACYPTFSNLIRTSFCRFLKRKEKSQFAVLISTFPSTAPCLQGRLIE